MPKLKRGNGGGVGGHRAKPGTRNKHQAAARDKRAADASEAELLAAAEALQALEAPAPPPAVVQPPTEPVPVYEPSNGEMAAYKRMAIVSAYQRLNCPPECEWGKHGGTLRQVEPSLLYKHTKYGHFGAQTLY
jgi:hypothetical protein